MFGVFSVFAEKILVSIILKRSCNGFPRPEMINSHFPCPIQPDSHFPYPIQSVSHVPFPVYSRLFTISHVHQCKYSSKSHFILNLHVPSMKYLFHIPIWVFQFAASLVYIFIFLDLGPEICWSRKDLVELSGPKKLGAKITGPKMYCRRKCRGRNTRADDSYTPIFNCMRWCSKADILNWK